MPYATTWRLGVAAVAALVAFVFAAACGTDIVAGGAPEGSACGDTNDCPSALRCGPAETAPNEAGVVSLDYSRWACTLPRNVNRRLALVAGFSVRETGLEQTAVDNEDAVLFTWEAPPNAGIVACALFGCTPEFKPVKRADGRITQVMSTFDRCVLAVGYFRASQGRGTIRDLVERRPSCGPTSICRSGYVLERTALGCWSYDDVSVNGATRLEEISPTRTPAARYFAQTCQLQTAEGRACALSASRGYGTCHHGVCRERCLSRNDCSIVGTIVEAGAPDAEVDGDAGGDAASRPTPPLAECTSVPSIDDFKLCIR
jgi:hypothetical protein